MAKLKLLNDVEGECTKSKLTNEQQIELDRELGVVSSKKRQPITKTNKTNIQNKAPVESEFTHSDQLLMNASAEHDSVIRQHGSWANVPSRTKDTVNAMVQKRAGY